MTPIRAGPHGSIQRVKSSRIPQHYRAGNGSHPPTAWIVEIFVGQHCDTEEYPRVNDEARQDSACHKGENLFSKL